jgi:hypothetical protein
MSSAISGEFGFILSQWEDNNNKVEIDDEIKFVGCKDDAKTAFSDIKFKTWGSNEA